MPTRREMMAGSAAVAAASFFHASPAFAENRVEAAVAKRTGGVAVNVGRVSLVIPPIAENGLAVFTTVGVESPMTSGDYVRAIHLISAKNPVAEIASFHLGPRAGRAKVSTNIRLSASQRVYALAEMSDGSFWADEKPVIVTVAACADGG